MKIDTLTIGMKVRHPQYGMGAVKQISESTAEVQFDDQTRILDPNLSELSPAEPQATVTESGVPLSQFIHQTVEALVEELGIEKPSDDSIAIAKRWHEGRLVLHPSDPTLQTKEVPLETFFHKIVMVRNNLRVLEQKINSNNDLSEAAKVELQQYITRSYGSLTTFNVLFKDKEDHF